MFKVIKIEGDTVFVGKGTDGQFTEIPLSSFGFAPVVGDFVEFYQNDNSYIVSKVDQLAHFANVQGRGGQSDKSKMVAGLFAFFLGSFGAYEFYIGKTGQGILRLAITAIGSIPVLWGLNLLINFIWNVINSICVLTSKPGSKWHQDALGRELMD